MTKVYSVVIPAYNAEKTIEACLSSVVQQTLAPLEVLVIDDHSSDRTGDAVRRCEGLLAAAGIRLEYILLAQNSGPSIARNRGISESRGNFIAFLDADDVWTSNKLEVVDKFANKSNVGLIFHSYTEIRSIYSDKGFDVYDPEVASIYRLLLRNIAPTSCVIVRKQHGVLFDETMRYCEDYDLIMKIAENSKILRLVGKPMTRLGRPQLTVGGLSGNTIRMRIGEFLVYYKFCSRNWLVRFWMLPLLLIFSFLKHIYSTIHRSIKIS